LCFPPISTVLGARDGLYTLLKSEYSTAAVELKATEGVNAALVEGNFTMTGPGNGTRGISSDGIQRQLVPWPRRADLDKMGMWSCARHTLRRREFVQQRGLCDAEFHRLIFLAAVPGPVIVKLPSTRAALTPSVASILPLRYCTRFLVKV